MRFYTRKKDEDINVLFMNVSPIARYVLAEELLAYVLIRLFNRHAVIEYGKSDISKNKYATIIGGYVKIAYSDGTRLKTKSIPVQKYCQDIFKNKPFFSDKSERMSFSRAYAYANIVNYIDILMTTQVWEDESGLVRPSAYDLMFDLIKVYIAGIVDMSKDHSLSVHRNSDFQYICREEYDCCNEIIRDEWIESRLVMDKIPRNFQCLQCGLLKKYINGVGYQMVPVIEENNYFKKYGINISIYGAGIDVLYPSVGIMPKYYMKFESEYRDSALIAINTVISFYNEIFSDSEDGYPNLYNDNFKPADYEGGLYLPVRSIEDIQCIFCFDKYE